MIILEKKGNALEMTIPLPVTFECNTTIILKNISRLWVSFFMTFLIIGLINI